MMQDLKNPVKGRRVFLSGPMSGIEHYNAPNFARAHALVRGLGAAEVYDPAIEWLEQDPAIDETADHEYYMRRCLHELTGDLVSYHAANEVPERRWDVLVSLYGWSESKGASLEHQVAMACGIEVVHVSDLEGLAEEGS